MAACSGEVDNPLADGPVPLGVTAEIGQVMSRAQAQSFEANDAIGVIPAQTSETAGAVTQYPFSYDGKNFNPGDARYYFADTDEKTFHAYYPYTEAVSQNAAITLNTRAGNQVVENLDEQRTWRKNDYLAATATASASKPTASYTGQQAFRHVMAQVVLTFQAGGGLTDLSALSSYTLTTPLAMDGTFSPASGAVTVDETKATETLTISGLTPGSDGKITSTLLLLPQSVADGQLGLDVTYDGKTYRAALSLPKPEGAEAGAVTALQAGTSYAYTVTIRQNDLSVGDAEIMGWNTETGTADALPVPFVKKPLAEAAVGDFYFSDGTIADKDAEFTLVQATTCIGVVFGVDLTSSDKSDYSETGIKQEKCHGYVVALRDVGRKQWAAEEAASAYIDALGGRWGDAESSGYANTQAIRAYAEAQYGEKAPDYFPAAYACLRFGTDNSRFAAPSSSSDWFLPAEYQLRSLQGSQASTLQNSFTKLRALGWGLATWLSSGEYWSSVQGDASEARVQQILQSDTYADNAPKSRSLYVRPILAF